MPSLSSQEVDEFNSIKTKLLKLWNAAIKSDELDINGVSKLVDINRRFIPNRMDGRRMDLDNWLNANFNAKVIKNLKAFQALSHTITEKLLTNNNSRETKVKKLTIYRKMIAELLNESYEKNSYNTIPYALFAFPDDGQIVAESNSVYTKKVTENNTGVNRIPMTTKILREMIKMAVEDLRKDINKSSDYGSKMLALELLTGRRQYEELLNTNCYIVFYPNSIFEVKGLAKASEAKKQQAFKLPYLGIEHEVHEGELAELLNKNLKLVRQYISEKSNLKSNLSTLLNRTILQASIPYDRLLKPVRMASNFGMIDGKSHTFRKFYAFSCYCFLDGCQSNESQYFAQVLAEGTLQSDGTLKLNLVTAKSYSIFTLVDSL